MHLERHQASRHDTQSVQVRHAPDLLTIEIGAQESYSFDKSACLVRAAWSGMMCRWGLDGSCLVKELPSYKRLPGSKRQRRLLPPQEGLELAAVGYRQAMQLCERVDAAGKNILQGATWVNVTQELQEHGDVPMFRRASLYQKVYKPVGILPPDQYGAIVLQLTEGCRYNRCAFCTFYRNMSYVVKTPADFAAHVQAVLELVGDAVNRRRTVFLGDANALGIPFPDLRAAFEVVNKYLPLGSPGGASGRSPQTGGIEGIYTFMDVFGRKQKSAHEFRALAELGLRRVYIGVESGSVSVLRILHKPEEIATLHSVVETMKVAGVGVGLIFLLGAGGEQYADEHAQECAGLLASLPLDAGDIVYFSELVADPDSDYAAWEAAEGIKPLSDAQMRAQEKTIRQGLVSIENGGPRVTRYDVREFIYY